MAARPFKIGEQVKWADPPPSTFALEEKKRWTGTLRVHSVDIEDRLPQFIKISDSAGRIGGPFHHSWFDRAQ